jgi:carbon-monoxide dehydrogenase medium subunit
MLVAPDLSYHRPSDPGAVGELLLALGPEARLLAGGTDLVVQLRQGRDVPRHLVDVGGIDSLVDVEVGPAGVRIPANARIADVVRVLRRNASHEALSEAGLCVGSMQIQNRATIVGNICNASPAADTVPALLVHGAVVEVAGPQPRREPLETFLRGPGRTSLGPGEWVSAVQLPPPSPGQGGSAYVKLGRTRGVDLALVGVACRLGADGARLAFASVGPTAVLLDLPGDVAAEPPEELGDVIATRIHPIDDVRASAAYRAAMAVPLAREAWSAAYARLRSVGAG